MLSGKKRNLEVVIYHPHGLAQGKFPTKKQKWKPVFDAFLLKDRLPHRKIILNFEEMEPWEKDAE